MDFNFLNDKTLSELKSLSRDMGLKIGNGTSKNIYIKKIVKSFREYEEYKKETNDRYKKIKQIGEKGKDGITYLVRDRNGKKYAMKTFRENKSSRKLLKEYNLQKKASMVGVSPRVLNHDIVFNYIVMEVMDKHLYDLIVEKKGYLNYKYQKQIIELFKKLDNAKVFHGDSNILNYMLKGDRIYLIDYGLSEIIDEKLIKKLGTDKPNIRIMTLGLILKLKELGCHESSWKYLKQNISIKEIELFRI